MKKLLLSTMLFALTITTSGCTELKKPTEEQDEKIVYTTIYPIKFFTEYMAEEYIEVKSIFDNTQDIHHYVPTSNDIIALNDADLILYNHLGAEREVIQKALESMSDNKTPKVIDVSLNVEPIKREVNEDGVIEPDNDLFELYENDEHFWLDPIRTITMVTNIKDALIEMFPDKQDKILVKYEELKVKLSDVDANMKKITEESPKDSIIVTHAAFGYWSKYDIEQISLTGLTHDQEKNPQQIAQIIDFCKEEGIHYILSEVNYNSDLVGAIINEISGETLILHDLSLLTDEDKEKGRNYFSIMDDNIKVLQQALQ